MMMCCTRIVYAFWPPPGSSGAWPPPAGSTASIAPPTAAGRTRSTVPASRSCVPGNVGARDAQLDPDPDRARIIAYALGSPGFGTRSKLLGARPWWVRRRGLGGWRVSGLAPTASARERSGTGFSPAKGAARARARPWTRTPSTPCSSLFSLPS